MFTLTFFAFLSLSPLQPTGQISGVMRYPACQAPKDLEVCAEPVKGKGLFCKPARSRYSLELPAGDYRVFSRAQSLGDYKAYYSEAVRCGLSLGCEDHTPLVVRVLPGASIKKVDPSDWFAPPSVQGRGASVEAIRPAS